MARTKTGHDRVMYEALHPKLKAALAEAGLAHYKINMLHLSPAVAEEEPQQPGCHMEKLANGHWMLVC